MTALLVVVWLTARAAGGEALPEAFVVRVWDTESGLPHNTVTSIAQTPDGYLWVGTLHGGLTRFDGSRFVNFHPGNTPALHSLEIQKLLVDSEGVLWIGVVDGSLVSYRDGHFRLEQPAHPKRQGWLSAVVASDVHSVTLASGSGMLFQGTRTNQAYQWDLLQSPDLSRIVTPCRDCQGTLWYRSFEGELGQVRNHQFERWPHPPGLRDPHINTMALDAEGWLWVGTPQELARWNGRAFEDITPPGSEPDLGVEQLATTREGGWWVRTRRGLRQYSHRQWAGPLIAWNWAWPRSSRPWSMYADSRGGVWLAHYGDGLWHVDSQGAVSPVGEQQGLPNNLVECCYEDHEGNVWVGLTGGGLACLRERVFHTVWPTEGFPHAAVRSICQDQQGAMWFGTSGDWLLRWRDGQFTSFVLPVERMIGLELSVCPDTQGRLWVGSVQNGVLTLENGQFSRPFPSREVGTVGRVLFTDHAGRVWIGNEFGLYCAAAGKLKHFTAAEGFAPAYVSAITEDKDSAIWVGTALGELRRYQGGRFTAFVPKDAFSEPADPRLPDPNRGALARGARFWALYADETGVLWIGTLGGGLLRFENGEFTRYGSREGLASEYVNQILEDGAGQLWLGTRAGIVRGNKKELDAFAHGATRSVSMVTYDKSDGLPSIDCSGGTQPACWRDRAGHLWFATAKGAVWVDPARLNPNTRPPPVWVEEVSVDGRRVTEAGQNLFNPAARVPERLQVPPGPHLLEFKFTALSLAAPEKVRFQWRLAGLDADWQPESSHRSVSYSFVPPGTYRFQVRACNNDGVWSEASASVALVVQAYFWQTWWFKSWALLTVFGLALGGGFWLFRRRHRLQIIRLEHDQALAQERASRAQERLAHQKAMERERARIAQDLHDDLGASLTQISWLGESASQAEFPPGERQRFIAQITAKSRAMVGAIDEIVWAVNPKNDSLDHLVTYVCEFAEEFFQGTSTRCRVDVQEPLPVYPLSSELRHNLFLVIKEALHNVAKHANAPVVRLRVRVEGQWVIFTVQDEGCGFAPGGRASGDGLENMRRRAVAIGALFELRSAPGQGTVVTWKLPLDKHDPTPQNHP